VQESAAARIGRGALATPKSVIFTAAVSLRSLFSGLISRCTIFWELLYATASTLFEIKIMSGFALKHIEMFDNNDASEDGLVLPGFADTTLRNDLDGSWTASKSVERTPNRRK
jgi:hypothetical protein